MVGVGQKQQQATHPRLLTHQMLLLEFCIDLQQMITWPLCHGELEDNCTISLDILCKLKKTKLPSIKMGGEKSIFTMSRMWFLSILKIQT